MKTKLKRNLLRNNDRQLEQKVMLMAANPGAPPAETSAPPAETSAPPAETSAPPAETSAPPAETSAPPAETSAPPAAAAAPAPVAEEPASLDRFGIVDQPGQSSTIGVEFFDEATQSSVTSDGRFDYTNTTSGETGVSPADESGGFFASFDGIVGTVDAGDGVDSVTLTSDALVDGGVSVALGEGDDTFTSSGVGGGTIFGGAGDDSITSIDGGNILLGEDGDDTISAGDLGSSLEGNAGNDILSAGDGANSIEGGEGNDTITSGDGASFIVGGPGDDSITAGDGGNTAIGDGVAGVSDAGDEVTLAFEGAGNDSITTGSGDDVIVSAGGVDTVDSGAGDDSISTGPGDDLIDAGPGDDLIDAGPGLDEIDGGLGDDFVEGGLGGDTIFGGGGNDIITPGAEERVPAVEGTTVGTIDRVDSGDNFVFAGPGDDSVSGSIQAEGAAPLTQTVEAGDGDDTVELFGGNDNFVDAGEGNDFIVGSPGSDTLIGGDGNDSVFGIDGNDSLAGGPGEDVLAGGRGTDFIDGGEGVDTGFDFAGEAGTLTAVEDFESIDATDNTGFLDTADAPLTDASFQAVESVPAGQQLLSDVDQEFIDRGIDPVDVSDADIATTGANGQASLTANPGSAEGGGAAFFEVEEDGSIATDEAGNFVPGEGASAGAEFTVDVAQNFSAISSPPDEVTETISVAAHEAVHIDQFVSGTTPLGVVAVDDVTPVAEVEDLAVANLEFDAIGLPIDADADFLADEETASRSGGQFGVTENDFRADAGLPPRPGFDGANPATDLDSAFSEEELEAALPPEEFAELFPAEA